MSLKDRRPSTIVDRVRAYGYTVGRCCYCGARTPGIICEAHDDLAARDDYAFRFKWDTTSRSWTVERK